MNLFIKKKVDILMHIIYNENLWKKIQAKNQTCILLYDIFYITKLNKIHSF